MIHRPTVCFVLVLVCSCNAPKHKEHRFASEEKKLLAVLSAYKLGDKIDRRIYVINSAIGCGGCIQEVANFYKKNHALPNFQYIVSTESKKQVRIAYPHALRQQSNFLYDSLSLATASGLITTKPKVIYCRDGKIIGIDEIEYSSLAQSLAKIKAFALSDATTSIP